MSRHLGLALCVVLGAAQSTYAQNLVIYPAKGQSPAQQDRDRFECHSFAVQQSGFDPSQSQAAAPSPQGPSPLRGAARGAAIGAVGEAIGGNAGKGAAIGAGTGALVGGIRRRDQNVQQQGANQQQGGVYNRALGTCMQAPGYSVG